MPLLLFSGVRSKAQGCVTYILTTTLATLNDSVLTLKDTANEVLSSNDDVEAGVLSSLIEHPAAGDGTLFVEVRGYRSYQTGSYTLYVEEEGAEVAFVSKVAPVEVTSQGATQLASALGFEGRIIDLSEAILVIDATERYALSISKKSGAIEFVDQIDYGALQTAGLIERHAAIEIATDFLEAIDLLPPVYEADSFPQIDTLNGSEVETSIGVAFTPLSQAVDGVMAPVRDGDIRLWIGGIRWTPLLRQHEG